MVVSNSEEGLLDRIVRIAFEETAPEIHALVVHRFPDDDAWLSTWIARKFIPRAANAQLVFVRSGEKLPGTEDDPHVLHFDTGGGEYDQHNRSLEKTCSAVLLANRLGVQNDPGLTELLKMATDVDNVRKLPPTSIHYAIEGYARLFQKENEVAWEKVQERVFELFNIVYGQEAQRARGKNDLEKFGRWTQHPNGAKVCFLPYHPNTREAAFAAGATVVIWTEACKAPFRGRVQIGIQRSRDHEYLKLRSVAWSLRKAEALQRTLQLGEQELGAVGEDSNTHWFLHDSLGFVCNGSRTHPLEREEEFSLLSLNQVLNLVNREVASMSLAPAGR